MFHSASNESSQRRTWMPMNAETNLLAPNITTTITINITTYCGTAMSKLDRWYLCLTFCDNEIV